MPREEREKEIILDVAMWLHSHSQLLTSIMHHIRATINYLLLFGPDGVTPMEYPSRQLSDTELNAKLLEAMKQVHDATERLQTLIMENAEQRGFDSYDLEVIGNTRKLADSYLSASDDRKKRHPYLREKVEKFMAVTRDKKLSKESRKDLARASSFLFRVASVADLEMAGKLVSDMQDEAQKLYEYLALSKFDDEQPAIVPVVNIVKDAIGSQSGYAASRRIEIRLHSKIPKGLKIEAQVTKITKALSNLINNAVKYSFQLRNDHAWVDLTVDIVGEHVVFVVEDWGLQIPPDEIMSGIIFRIGHKGSLSMRQGAQGAGLGLSYAREVAESHNGSMSIESRPAAGYSNSRDNTLPYITTVRMSLPVASSTSIKYANVM